MRTVTSSQSIIGIKWFSKPAINRAIYTTFSLQPHPSSKTNHKANDKPPLTVPPKAYRWVREMEEIAETHVESGFSGNPGIYGEIAKVYKAVAEDTILGEETTERRKRGLTVEDVAEAMGEGLGKKRKTG